MGNKSNAAVKHFFVDKVGGTIKRAYNWVTKKVGALVNTVDNRVSGIVKTLHDDAVGVTKGVKELLVKTEDTVSGTVKTVSHDVTTLGTSVAHDAAGAVSSLSLPLVVGGLAVAAYLVMGPKIK